MDETTKKVIQKVYDQLLEDGYHYPNDTICDLMELLGIPEPGDEDENTEGK